VKSPLLRFGACIAVALALAACGGDDGAQGPQGVPGTPGAPGPAGPPGPAAPQAVFLTANTPPATFAALDLATTVTSVSVNPATATTNPGTVVNFKIADRITGAAIVGYGSRTLASGATVGSYPNLAFSLAKLIPAAGGSPSRWVNYIVTSVSGTGVETLNRPSTDNQGTLVDNGDGTYKYTFKRDVTGIAAKVTTLPLPTGANLADLDNLTYDANATHRLTIALSGNAPGTGTNTPNAVQVVAGVPMSKPLNVIHDFVPATGAAPAASANRKMVANANCESCHSTLGGLPGQDEASLLFHGGGRNDIEYCVICHTEQRKFNRPAEVFNSTTRAFTGSTYRVDGQAVGNVLSFLHKIHVAGSMTRTNYDYAGVLFDKGGYSQDIRNCDKCHDSTGASTGGTPLPQAALWKTEANLRACSSCHDGINFTTGIGLTLGDKRLGLTTSTGFFGQAHPANATDGTCLNSGCHAAGAPGDPDVMHKPVSPPNRGSFFHVANGDTRTNAAWVASNTSRLPAGAIKVDYEVKEVRLNGARNPEIVFRVKFNDVVTPVLDFATAPNNSASGRKEMFANFMGAPSAQFVWAVAQDGVAAPVDFNASASSYIRSAWDGSDVNTTWAAGAGADAGYYVVTKLNATVPVGAVMFYGGIGYSYQITTTLPLTQTNLPAYPVPDGSGLTNNLGLTGGLIVIAPNADRLGTGFTARRAIVDDKRCQSCHQELGTFTEAVFHGGQRNNGATCSWCHNPNRSRNGWSVDAASFVHAIHASAPRNVPFNYYGVDWSKVKYPGVLARCDQCHVPGSYDFTNTASANAVGLGADQIDKRLVRQTAVGTLVAGSVGLSPWAAPGVDYGAAGAATNLVTSETVTVCSSCHDSNLAISHMELNGGTFYKDRTTALGRTEQCFVCHASGRVAGITEVHAR
jgi:OmcA/MtrC family decaheme c-type cytochrome